MIWVQEEPKNMGARAHVRLARIVERLPNGFARDRSHRTARTAASPSEGYSGGARGRAGPHFVREALTEI